MRGLAGRERRRFAAYVGQLAPGSCAAPRSEAAVRILEEAACRAPGARRGVPHPTVRDHLAVAGRSERAPRPLSLPRYEDGWYEDVWYEAGASGADRGADPGVRDGRSAVGLRHAAAGGTAAPPDLPGPVAKRFSGVPLPVTAYGVRLRAHHPVAGGPVAPSGDPAPGAGRRTTPREPVGARAEAGGRHV
ncbi:hypothetical protein [Streptomyces sp. NPDC088261]|uniref:hypothetical protein n=1 Tax=Streptomyces sp. NPDC088261 TaxID=3365851 RepID=UPI003826CA58